MHGIPDGLVLMRAVPEEVDVQLKSFSSLTPLPSKLDIAADIDLSSIREGQNLVRIKPSDFSLPSGMAISSVSPPSIKVTTERKQRKSVPVRVRVRGGGVLQGSEVVAEPAMVEVEGPADQVARVDVVVTEELDASQLARGEVARRNLVPPLKQVSVLRDEPVTISVRKKPRRK
jgi:YbbR domain-containing protein